jgi:hypothetical protein
MTSDNIKDFMCAAITLICSVHRSVKLLQLPVVTSYKCSVDPVTNPNPVCDKLVSEVG